jgi:phage tail tape-measure protein
MVQNLKINITAKDKTQQAFQGVRGRLKGLKDSIFSVQGALVGLGGGLAIRSIVGTGRSIEDLQVRLKQLFGSTEEGAKAFDVMANFAAKVPFSLEQIQQASGNLAVVAGDADQLSKILEITGNVAAVTGLDFATTAEQIQRSFAGGIASADIFRERGVRDLLGFSAGATVSAEETIKAFEKVFGQGGRFGKATDELANTFTGTLSMLGDKLFNFKRDVAGEGFFDQLKKEFKSLNEFIEANSADFEAVGRAISKTLTVVVKAFAAAVRAVARAVGFVRRQVENLLRLLGKDIPLVVEIDKVGKSVDDTNVKLGKQQTLFEKIRDGIKKQNDAFDLSKEIVGTITKSVGSV